MRIVGRETRGASSLPKEELTFQALYMRSESSDRPREMPAESRLAPGKSGFERTDLLPERLQFPPVLFLEFLDGEAGMDQNAVSDLHGGKQVGPNEDFHVSRPGATGPSVRNGTRFDWGIARHMEFSPWMIKIEWSRRDQCF
jgi:hypothetical protein